MKKWLFLLILMWFCFSCRQNNEDQKKTEPINYRLMVFNEEEYVLDDSFPIGDTRRYGVSSETAKLKHPFSGQNRLITVLEIAEKSNIEMVFPEGYYAMDLTLNSRQNLNLKFNSSEFNLVQIAQTADSLPKPKNIRIKGNLIAYDRLSLTEASKIEIDTVTVKSSPERNLRRGRSRGCHIYHGCKDIKIGYLQIEDLGSDLVKDKYTHAALAIDGWNNNPVNVQIDKVYINSTDRHGIYLTGRDHVFGELIINKFGIGSSEGMDPMQDAKPGEEKDFKALWINKCFDTFIEKVVINEKSSKAKYSAHFDAGNKQQPVTIERMVVLNDNPNIENLEDPANGVIVEIFDKEE